MKADKKHADSSIQQQLSEKIKDADDSRKRYSQELIDKISMILGSKDVRITIPKNSKALAQFINKVN